MKKYLLAPLCSAFIVPGLGQVLIGNTKKGLILMASVFVLIVILAIDLILIFKSILETMTPSLNKMGNLLEKFMNQDHTSLNIIIILFLLVWIYSIIDAFVTGIRANREKGEDQ